MKKKMLSILRNIPAEFGEMLDKMEKFEGETIFEYDCATSRIWIYGAASELFEGHEQTISDFKTDKRLADVIDPADMERILRLYYSTTPELSRVTHVCQLHLHEEGKCWYRVRLDIFFDEKGNRTSVFGELADVDVVYKHFLRISHDASHDGLTGLYRHHYAQERVLERLQDPDVKALLMFLDLDNFKEINDSHGHVFGDKVLKMLADRLLSQMGDDCVISRWGGDEIMAFVPYEGSPKEAAERLQAAGMLTIDGVAVSISSGAADTVTVGRDYDKLFLCADLALLQAKQQGKKRCVFYEPQTENEEDWK